jgi:uncharacterized protein YcfJ
LIKLLLFLVVPAPLWAANLDTEALLGGALGGAVGALVGSEFGGRQGAIIGSAIGGATGTALTTRRRQPRHEATYDNRPIRREVIYMNDPHDQGLHRGHRKPRHKYRHYDYDD